MADFKILCPACTAVLSSKKPIPNGKKITCPNCKKPFVAATSDVGADSGSLEFEFSPPAAEGVIAAAPHRPTAARTIERPTPRPHPRLAAGSGSNKAVLWIIMILLLVVALGGGGAGVYFYLKTQELQTAESPRDKAKKEKAAQIAQAKEKDKEKKGEAGKDDKATKPSPKTAGGKGDGEAKPVTPNSAPKEDLPKTKVPEKAKPAVAEWLEYKSEPGGYVVQFPAKPTDRKERDDDLIFHEKSAELNGFEYEVTFHQMKKDEAALPAKERLKMLVAEYKETIGQPKEVEFEKIPMVPAMEVLIPINGKKDIAFERVIVYREHVYQIRVSGDRATIGPDQVAPFMKSFRFVGEPRGGFLDLTQTQGIPPERRKR